MRGTVLSLSRIVILAVAVAGLAGCGRNGVPITREAAAAEEANRTQGLVPVPSQQRESTRLPKPKRDFVLDPLL